MELRQIVRVDESYRNQTVELRRGQLLELTLDSNPTTGYSWQYAQPVDNRVLRQIYYRYVPAAPWLVGGGGREHWVYRAVGYGTTLILLYYVRPWQYRQRPAEVFSLRVNVI